MRDRRDGPRLIGGDVLDFVEHPARDPNRVPTVLPEKHALEAFLLGRDNDGVGLERCRTWAKGVSALGLRRGNGLRELEHPQPHQRKDLQDFLQKPPGCPPSPPRSTPAPADIAVVKMALFGLCCSIDERILQPGNVRPVEPAAGRGKRDPPIPEILLRQVLVDPALRAVSLPGSVRGSGGASRGRQVVRSTFRSRSRRSTAVL